MGLKKFDKMGKGFTFIEILIATMIVVVLVAIAFSALTSFRESNNLFRSTDLVIESLNKAKVRSLASKNQLMYGIHLASTTVTLFAGAGYNASDDSNEVSNLPVLTEVSNFSPNNATTSLDIVFKRLTGETDNPGIITLRATRNLSKTKQIEVYNSGLVEIK